MSFRTARSPLLVATLATALATACAVEEDPPIADALPTAESVQIKLPDAQQRSIGQLAEYYVLTRQVTRDLNAGAAWVLVVVHTVVQFPATTIEGSVYTWGPWSGSALDPAEWKLVVTASGDGTFDWELDGRSKSSPEDGFIPVITGHAVPGDEPHRGSGDFRIDFDAGEQVNPVDNTPDNGAIDVTYDLENRDGTAASLTMHAEGIDSLGNPGSFDYAYAENQDGSGDFQFGLETDVEENGSAAEQALIRSRWLASGAGRADASISGGDLGGFEVEASECWSEQFRRTYYTDSADFAPTEGDPADCVFDAAVLADF
ncbi:MAG TPA: hypothetical protein VEL05_10240 [Candidatus Acidoferrum sp.]|nr:hypothetical protein [Candidatus Acidoferrum sp.]